jgi:ring-1,2-phenylacetyl-CoA epoxidase subunit PaaC
LLELADDELVLGWRNSEWTGIAPFLEEDVAFSSIAQGEIGHARALYELAAERLDTDADALAFDRPPDEYRCCQLVELRLLEWAPTIARQILYEIADAVRLESLRSCGDAEVEALADRIDREEVYHRLHAKMWLDRLLGDEDGRRRLEAAIDDLWPYALGVVAEAERDELAERVRASLPFELPAVRPLKRGEHPALAELWEEMTVVRRSVPGAAW